MGVRCKDELCDMTDSPSAYTETFYEERRDRVRASAAIVAPLVMDLFSPRSVTDFGCGTGEWLEAFSNLGVKDYLGLDGDYVSRDKLAIPSDRFRAVDLNQIPAPGKFDLAMSLEVAEHLHPASADAFVDALTAAAPVILFSAAIPFQGGTDHFNEQWQSYWAEKFAARGFVCLDCLRPQILDNQAVNVWYRQNILIYCREVCVPDGLTPISDRFRMNYVHPDFYADKAVAVERLADRLSERRVPQSGKEALKMIAACAGVLVKSAGRTLKKKTG